MRAGTSNSPTARPGARASVLFALALVAAVVVAYLPALSAGFIWNDDTYLTANRTLDGLDGLRLAWTDRSANEQYYPLVFTTFWIEKRLWGLDPLGYHLVNVLLHAGSALLLWRLLLRLGLPGARLAAAAFALHPLCAESVVWITERKNTLSLVLSLLAVHAWLRWREGRKPTLWAAAFAFFVLALLAKTTACVVPFVLLVIAWWRKGRVERPELLALAPLFAAGALLALQTAWLERTLVRATGLEWSLGAAARVVLAGQISAFYAGRILVPADLAFVYARWTPDPGALAAWLSAAAALAAAALAWRLRDRVGRGPAAALALYVGALFPALGFFNVYPMRFSWVADHFAYQAVAVAAAALSCGAASALARGPASRRRAAGAVAAVLLVAFGILTNAHARTFRDEETLWTTTLAKNPACFMCETNYGIWLLERGRLAEAALHLETSRRLKPDEVPTLLNLATIDERRGRFEAAAETLRAARSAAPENEVVLVNLGNAEARLGRVDAAIACYRDAVRSRSAVEYLAHNGLGAALMRRGDPAEAIAHFREAVRLKPDYASARTNLERALRAHPDADAGLRPRP